MNTQPVTAPCRALFDQRAHICIGISPFNSYFSESRIRELAKWARREFKSMHLFVPDVPSAWTLEALGYDPEKAAWKARRQAQYLHNKIHRALREAGYTDLEACERVLNWERLSANPHYMEIYLETQALFESDPVFQRSCLEASRWVLEKRVPDVDSLSPEALRSAVRYLLAEIPLFVDTPRIVGVATSVFCYHQCPEFIAGLYQNQHALRASSQQGFLVVEASANESSTAEIVTDPLQPAMGSRNFSSLNKEPESPIHSS